MKYRFQIHMSEKDYVAFNQFLIYKSPYGKKQFVSLRIVVAVMILIAAVFSLFREGAWPVLAVSLILWALALIAAQLCLKPLYNLILKRHVKQMKKTGKMPYSSESTMEFYDDYFVETAEDNKTERKYSAMERVSVQEGKRIYIHLNRAMAYIIPVNAFESVEQYEEFLKFIKTKCSAVDFY